MLRIVGHGGLLAAGGIPGWCEGGPEAAPGHIPQRLGAGRDILAGQTGERRVSHAPYPTLRPKTSPDQAQPRNTDLQVRGMKSPAAQARRLAGRQAGKQAMYLAGDVQHYRR